ncbi:hypothetical protein Bhyg_11222 [Pseudolycoriella hygida]|uniref:Uncharacterized protein n=1 Tax=Pseudolycoriella hygida TaxID=35572 RepID=A0A9Q0MXM3_9DIPT|nr:hypothetical protein Bhyg_11222 [Pseudolycoriella hygida]
MFFGFTSSTKSVKGNLKKMKVLLCYMFLSFCIFTVAPTLQVTMNGPFESCPDLKNTKLELTGLKFIQKTDNDFTLNGKYVIKETINGPISLKINSKKYERGTWVNSMLNQNIQDLCSEMEKEEKQDEWIRMFQEWTANKKCPFVKKQGEYKDFYVFNSKNAPDILPPNIYGKYKSEARFYQTINGDLMEFGCFIVYLELANF